ncbi:recombinase family protein [Cytobacillus gottheilii]|uniref:Recombinase family protein n=1 Tax=Cytobacillus gottheilii TaxID=859144 RepID=A0ABX8FCY0_9BACI|nr:recombinase family protein [Cytobacillus gottheilii]QVY61945.1 recombinase family protein [Cytobacillus gottheilii]
MEEKNLIVKYYRVSSASQGLELQLSSAKRYFESVGLTGEEEFVVELCDHNVSATKLKMEERRKLMELIRLIQEGKVKKVIVYKRDRLARNFYEFVDITRIFIKYNVEVIYTASNEPPFRNKLALEAFYGMFGQMEGENIRTRTGDTRKQYPSSIFGYTRLKEDNRVCFVVNKEKRDSIVSLFTEFSNVKDEEQFFNFFMTRHKGLNQPEKRLRILTNPFYAAHYESKSGLHPMAHVEPLISLDLFLATKAQMDKFLDIYKEKLNEVNSLFLTTPLCGKCGNIMKHRKQNVLDEGYFVCSSNHKRLMITVLELNDSIKHAVLEHVKSMSAQLANKIMSKHIAITKKRLEHEKDIATSEYLETSLELSTINLSSKSVISKYLDKIQILKDKSNKIDQDLMALKLLSNEVKTIDKIFYQKELSLSQPNIHQLIEMLVHEVLVHESYIGIDLFLSAFIKELDAS